MKLKNGFFLILFAGLCCFSTNDLWSDSESIGPYGGQIGKIVIDPQRPNFLYGLGAGMIFKSENAGESWKNISPAIFSQYERINFFMVPGDSDQLYLIAPNGQVLRSTDAGETWQDYFFDVSYRVFFIDPNNPGYLLAYQPTDHFRATLVRSSDGGNTWKEIINNIDLSVGAISVFVNQNAPDYMMAIQLITYGGDVVHGENVFKTDDKGEHWNKIDIGETGASYVIFDPADPKVIYIMLYSGGLRTVDGGNTWQKLGEISKGRGLAWFSFDPNNSSILYGVVGETENRRTQPLFKSVDKGLNWLLLAFVSPAIGIRPPGVNPHNPSQLFVGSYPFGPLRSDDGGAAWEIKNVGISATSVYSTAVLSPDTIFAVVENVGIMRALDGGRSWEVTIANTSTIPGKVVISSGNPNRVYSNALPESLYISDPTLAESGGLAVSDDYGHSWRFHKAIRRGLCEFDVGSDNRTIYGSAFLGDQDGLVISGIIKSSDGGLSWKILDLGIPHVNWIAKIRVDPRNPDIVYAQLNIRNAINQNILVKTTDGGSHWTTIAQSVVRFYLNSANPDFLYYIDCENECSLYRSNDQGNHWLKLDEAPDVPHLVDLAFHPKQAEILVAATTELGILLSRNYGDTWTQIIEKEESTEIRNLIIASSNKIILLASTRRNGVKKWVIADSLLTSVTSQPPSPRDFKFMGNFPNPFNSSTVIQYTLLQPMKVSLKIYDIKGRLVRLLEQDQIKNSGLYEASWDGKDRVGRRVASGVYFCELFSGGHRETHKMILVR